MNIDSREGAKSAKEIYTETLPLFVVDVALYCHMKRGPGLLGSVCAVDRGGALERSWLSKEGCKRVVSDHTSFASSRLRVSRIESERFV